MSWVLDGPWQRREVVWPSVRVIAGLIGIWVAYFGCSGTLEGDKQSWWLAIGGIALIVSLSGVAGWVRVGLRNLRHLERLMLGTARAQFAGAAAAVSADAQRALEADTSALVTVPGATLVHRADCLLVAGKAAQTVSFRDAPRDLRDVRAVRERSDRTKVNRVVANATAELARREV